MKDDIFYFYVNEENIDNYPLSVLSNNSNFNFTILDYKVSDKMIWSLVQNSFGNLMYNNSGIKPDLSNKMASIIEVDFTNNEYFLYDTSKTDFIQSTNYPYGTFDGLFGISNEDVLDSYMVTHQIKKDNFGNIWVVNPFSEQFNHPLSVQIANNNQHWMHIFSEDESSYWLLKSLLINIIGFGLVLKMKIQIITVVLMSFQKVELKLFNLTNHI